MQTVQDISAAVIEQLEEDLLNAMRLNDISFLDTIFSDDYHFIGSDGSTWGKEKAINDYRHPHFKLNSVTVTNRQIFMHADCAIVSGNSSINGKVGTENLTGNYFFVRVWKKVGGNWNVIAVITSSTEGRE